MGGVISLRIPWVLGENLKNIDVGKLIEKDNADLIGRYLAARYQYVETGESIIKLQESYLPENKDVETALLSPRERQSSTDQQVASPRSQVIPHPGDIERVSKYMEIRKGLDRNLKQYHKTSPNLMLIRCILILYDEGKFVHSTQDPKLQKRYGDVVHQVEDLFGEEDVSKVWLDNIKILDKFRHSASQLEKDLQERDTPVNWFIRSKMLGTEGIEED
jgi:hypothetical protein